MAKRAQQKVTNRRLGTQQQDRFLPALSPQSVAVDEKSLAQNLEFTYRYAALIKLHDQHNALFGNWQWMLQNDSSFTLGSIASVDLAEFPVASSRAIRAFEQAHDLATRNRAISELFLCVNQLALNLADWVTRIGLIPDDQLGLQDMILEMVKTDVGKLLGPLEACLLGLSGSLPESPSLVMGRNFFEDVHYVMTHLVPLLGLPAADGPDAVLFTDLFSYFSYLKDLYKYLYRCNVHVKSTLGPLLSLSLQQPNHSPSNVLLVAMQQLMAPAVTTLNTITQRHLDFYYRQVLQMAPQPPIPDQVRVQFLLKKGVDTTLVAAGTALLAGKGAEGEDLIYTTDKELLVNRVKIAQVMTVHNAGATAAQRGSGQLYATATAAVAAPWAAFGGVDANAVAIAPVGLVVGDPVLFMHMGDRKVALAFCCDATSFEVLDTALLQWAKPNETTSAAFARLVGDAFAVSYTGPKGWVDAPLATRLQLLAADGSVPAALGIPDSAQGCWLSLHLDADAAAVVAYDAALHGPGYAQGMPLLRLNLVPPPTDDAQDDPTPYNLLRGLAFTQLAIAVTVTGKTDLAVQNDLSAVNPQKPFQAFGSAPELGANLYIGSPEAFRKQLKSLKVTIDWTKLPATARGFADYYAIWNEVLQTPTIHNDSFRVAVSLLQKRTWVLLKPSAPADDEDYLLFDWEKGLPASNADPATAAFDPSFWLLKNLQPDTASIEAQLTDGSVRDGKLKAQTVLDAFELSGIDASIRQIPAGSLPTPFTYTTDQPSGFLRLQLSAPADGFGTALFAEANYQVNAWNLANMADVARDTTGKTELVLLAPPATPFVPMAAGLSIDYTAWSSYTVGKVNAGTLYWVQPFGVTAAVASLAETITLLPDYADEGTLYLGLSDVHVPQTLTILAQVDENSASTTILAKPKVAWSYLVQGQWRDFKSTEVLTDGTLNFSQSGIVELMLNVAPSADGGWFNTIADSSSLLWVRASVPSATAATCKVLLLDTQAVTATYVLGPSANAHLAAPLAAGTATKMAAPLGGIDKVLQPYDGFGGKVGEADHHMYTRVHERLRHKNRGVSQWDIERILLETFPEIGVVNCFNHSTTTSSGHPGKTLVVVFPGGSQLGQPNPYAPKFPLSKLSAYQTFLQGVVPSGMQATVINPPYEQLQVQASVRFMPGLDPGYYLGQLNNDLCAYISPWAAGMPPINPFATLLSRALIKGFINGLSYIEGVVTLNVYQSWEVDGQPYYTVTAGDYDYFEPHAPWYLLTTARQHVLMDADSPSLALVRSTGIVVAAATPPGAAGLGSAGIAQPPMGAVDAGLQEYIVVDLKT